MTGPIARIEAALARLGAEHEPPPGWEARVLAATAARSRRSWWWIPVPVVALAAACVLLVVHPWRTAEFALVLAYDRGSHVEYRGAPAGDDAQRMVGDTVRATAKHGAPFRAVWIYRSDRLVAACPRDLPCRVTGDDTRIDFVLSSIGRYAIIALHSSAPIPPPSGPYDADVAGAERAGAATVVTRVDVR